MARVSVKIGGLTADWAAACRHAVTHLNAVFSARHINVVLETNGLSGPVISVKTDASIQGNAVHGRTTSEFNTAGGMLRAEVRLPSAYKSTPRQVSGTLGLASSRSSPGTSSSTRWGMVNTTRT
jgi:hypothetical protein